MSGTQQPAGEAGSAGGAAPAATIIGQTGGATSATGGTPGGAADARDWLPEGYRNDPSFAYIGNVDTLAKSYKHAVSMVGLDRNEVLRLPKEANAPEWSEVWNRLGRPEKPDAYELTPPQGLDDATLNQFRQTAHELGISQAQAAKLMEFYGGSLAQQQERTQQQAATVQAEVVSTLKREWGQTYDDQLHAAARAVREVGGPEMVQLLEQTRLGDHPAVIKMFAQIGAGRAEQQLKGGGGDYRGNVTPAMAQQEIAQLRGDTEFGKAIMDRGHPGHAAAKTRWDALQAAAFPPEPAA